MTVESARKLLDDAGLFFGYDKDDPEDDPKNGQTLNMNDTWCWASAWGVYVQDDQLDEVARLFTLYGFCGVLYWVSINNDNLKSEFPLINRRVEFVSREEKIRKTFGNYSDLVYKKVSYTIGK